MKSRRRLLVLSETLLNVLQISLGSFWRLPCWIHYLKTNYKHIMFGQIDFLLISVQYMKRQCTRVLQQQTTDRKYVAVGNATEDNSKTVSLPSANHKIYKKNIINIYKHTRTSTDIVRNVMSNMQSI